MEIRKKHLNVSLTHEIVGGGGSRMTDNIFQVFFFQDTGVEIIHSSSLSFPGYILYTMCAQSCLTMRPYGL